MGEGRGEGDASDAGIKNLRNVGMIHQGQCLALGLEAGHDLPGVHAEFDDFERDFAPHRLLLFGHIDHTATAVADFLEQPVASNAVTGVFRGGRLCFHRRCRRLQPKIQQALGAVSSHAVGRDGGPAVTAFTFRLHGYSLQTELRPNLTGD